MVAVASEAQMEELERLLRRNLPIDSLLQELEATGTDQPFAELCGLLLLEGRYKRLKLSSLWFVSNGIAHRRSHRDQLVPERVSKLALLTQGEHSAYIGESKQGKLVALLCERHPSKQRLADFRRQWAKSRVEGRIVMTLDARLASTSEKSIESTILKRGFTSLCTGALESILSRLEFASSSNPWEGEPVDNKAAEKEEESKKIVEDLLDEVINEVISKEPVDEKVDANKELEEVNASEKAEEKVLINGGSKKSIDSDSSLFAAVSVSSPNASTDRSPLTLVPSPSSSPSSSPSAPAASSPKEVTPPLGTIMEQDIEYSASLYADIRKDILLRRDHYLQELEERRIALLTKLSAAGGVYAVNGVPCHLTAQQKRLLRIPEAYRTAKDIEEVKTALAPPEGRELIDLDDVTLAVEEKCIAFEELPGDTEDTSILLTVLRLDGQTTLYLPVEDSALLRSKYPLAPVEPCAPLAYHLSRLKGYHSSDISRLTRRQ